MAISTINQAGLTNPLTAVAANTVASATGSALTLQTNGSTTAVTINTSQQVAIGTNTITDAHLLNVVGPTTSNNIGIVLNDTTTPRCYAIDSGGGALKFFDYTASAERMRIDSSGNVLVGCTSSPASGSNGVLITGTQGQNFWQSRCNTTANYGHMDFYNPNGLRGEIATNGTNLLFTNLSDYRLKENVAPMTGALAKITLLKPCTYNFKVDGSDGQGFIAHELQEVCPDAVTGTKDAVDAEGNPSYQGIDTSFLVATLTAAIQELNAKVDAQAAEIQALKAGK